MSETYMTYKNRPVVRSGKTIYYGSMAEPYVVMMNVNGGEQQGDVNVATAIKCYLMKTDKSLNPMEAIIKTAERATLLDALELASVWLKAARA
ncbi:MAG: hypothetical protein K6E36_09120 [Oscillospiraceae bacterium]|nr:hypothetical protein [Oscillospiraceae bacterium]MCR5306645.1 hypothetical protein [Oscillospiraceae bacterium]